MTAQNKWEEMIRQFRESGKSQRGWCRYMILRPLGKVYTSDETYSITQEELSWLMHDLRVEEIKRYEAMKRKFPTV